MTSSRAFKTAIYEQLARIAKALASPPRLELLDLLAQGPKNVDLLARQSGQSRANTSQHLKVLRGARLVEATKRGSHVTYRLAGDEVADHYLALRRLAEVRLAEIERITADYLRERGQLEQVERADLVERVRSGAVTVIDVRPADEFESGHLPGAVSVPLAELERRLDDLSPNQEVVAYCRGPYCVLSVEAVALLRARGFRASRLDDGVHEWRARGEQIVSGVGRSLQPSSPGCWPTSPLTLFLGGLGLFAVPERLAPRRVLSLPRLRRQAANLGLAIVNRRRPNHE